MLGLTRFHRLGGAVQEQRPCSWMTVVICNLSKQFLKRLTLRIAKASLCHRPARSTDFFLPQAQQLLLHSPALTTVTSLNRTLRYVPVEQNDAGIVFIPNTRPYFSNAFDIMGLTCMSVMLPIVWPLGRRRSRH